MGNQGVSGKLFCHNNNLFPISNAVKSVDFVDQISRKFQFCQFRVFFCFPDKKNDKIKGRCEISSSQDKTTIMNLNITEKANTKNTERPVKTLHWPKVEQEGDVFLPKEIKLGEKFSMRDC